MEEKTTKKREWIKNAAIIFLAVMLLLTFFSNTIMNYSLPEVATVYVTQGTITTKVRGTGTVIAEDPYSVTLAESRVIKSVEVKKDEHVEAGDVLYYLEDKDSTELTTAKDELAQQEIDYQKLILNAGISRVEVNNIETGNVPSLQENQAQIEAMKTAMNTAEAKVKEWTDKVAELQKKLDLLDKTTVDATAEKNALATAQRKLNDQNAELEKYANLLQQAKDALEADPTNQTLIDACNKAQVEYNLEFGAAKELEAAVANAKDALDNKLGNTDISNQINDISRQKVNAQAELDKAAEALKVLTEDQEENLAKILNIMDIGKAYQSLIQKRKTVDDMIKKAVGASVTAPVAGFISQMNYTAGQTTTGGEEVAVIRKDGKDCTVSFSVTNEQAKKVNIGDIGEVQNSWYYDEISLTLASIKPDPDNAGKNKLLTFDIKGDVTPGQTLGVSVGQRSSEYDLVVPNSAIREDNDGKFILVVVIKSTPFGNRYIATKTEVVVNASDDNNTAITAPLYGYEYVITTSNKPVEPGQQVRLAE